MPDELTAGVPQSILRLAVTPRISTAREASNQTQTRAIGGGYPANESPRHTMEPVPADSKVPQVLDIPEGVQLLLGPRNDVVESIRPDSRRAFFAPPHQAACTRANSEVISIQYFIPKLNISRWGPNSPWEPRYYYKLPSAIN